jgi:hypothetical protein
MLMLHLKEVEAGSVATNCANIGSLRHMVVGFLSDFKINVVYKRITDKCFYWNVGFKINVLSTLRLWSLAHIENCYLLF